MPLLILAMGRGGVRRSLRASPGKLKLKCKQRRCVKLKRDRRLIRCGSCDGCLAAYCGKCVFCLDMPRFGGANQKRKLCVEKRCKVYGYSRNRNRGQSPTPTSAQSTKAERKRARERKSGGSTGRTKRRRSTASASACGSAAASTACAERFVSFAGGPLGIFFVPVGRPPRLLVKEFLKAADGSAGPAERSGRVRVADAVYSVGGKRCEERSAKEAFVLIKRASRPVTIGFRRATDARRRLVQKLLGKPLPDTAQERRPDARGGGAHPCAAANGRGGAPGVGSDDRDAGGVSSGDSESDVNGDGDSWRDIIGRSEDKTATGTEEPESSTSGDSDGGGDASGRGGDGDSGQSSASSNVAAAAAAATATAASTTRARPQPPTISQYERQRLANIRRNATLIERMGLTSHMHMMSRDNSAERKRSAQRRAEQRKKKAARTLVQYGRRTPERRSRRLNGKKVDYCREASGSGPRWTPPS